MRVSVSPWDIAETSLHVAAAKKRRRQSRETSSDFCVLARFVPHRRSFKKARGLTEKIAPAVIITGEHRVTVIGTSSNGNVLEESDVLQYSSRPGSSSAFLPKDGGAGSIPAIYDTKQERVYAFQNGNKRLICWRSNSGPDKAETVELDKAALDLSVFRDPTSGKTVLYGSCTDGRVFVLSAVSDSNAMKVAYVDSPASKAKNGTVISTLARPLVSKDTKHEAGSKRKSHSSNSFADQCLAFYQIIRGGRDVNVVCQHIKLSRNDDTTHASVFKSITFSVTLAPSNSSITAAKFAGSLEERNQIGLFYSVGEDRHFFSLIALEKGLADKSPIELPADTKHVGFAGPNILAVGTDKNIQVLDMMRGARIHEQPLPALNEDHGYSLIPDSKRARLGITFVQDETVCIAFATGTFHSKLSSLTTQKGTMSLASSLSASLQTSPEDLQTSQFVRSTEILSLDIKSRSRKSDEVAQSVNIMLQAYSMVKEAKKEASCPSFLLRAFDNALLGSSHDHIPSGSNGKKMNGAPLSPRKVEMVNGIYGTNGKGMDGESPRLAETEMPLPLADCVATLAVQFLMRDPDEIPGSVQIDASYLLKHVIRSKKVLARRHLLPSAGDVESFAKLFPALASVDASRNDGRVYNPVDLAMDILSFCPDVSEKQMIASLHFVLCHASATDIANHFISDSDEAMRSLSERYVSLLEGGGSEKEIEKLSSGLVTSCASKLLKRILSYSSCNDSLLRGALADGLNRQEMGVLGRLLVESFSDSVVQEATGPSSARLLQATKWLSALCDCLQGEPVDSKAVNIALLRRHIAAEISKTRSILSLKRFISEDVDSDTPSPVVAVRPPSKRSASRTLPSYQIESLVF